MDRTLVDIDSSTRTAEGLQLPEAFQELDAREAVNTVGGYLGPWWFQNIGFQTRIDVWAERKFGHLSGKPRIVRL